LVVNQVIRKSTETAEFNYWYLFFHKLKQNWKSDSEAVLITCRWISSL